MTELTPQAAVLAKLRWQCRRGMKELDELMLYYLENHYQQAPAEEQQQFVDLLSLEDPYLFAIMLGREAAPAALADLVQKIRNQMSR